MNSYDLSRNFFNWCFDNPEKVSPNHAAIYFFAIEHCNRLGWKEKFGFPTQMAMEAIGIKKHQTYIKYFNELCEWNFFKLVQQSKNQYSANIISLVYAMPKKGKALDKANINHTAKQTQSNGQSNSSIDKQETKEQLVSKHLFTKDPLFEKKNFAAAFPEWSKEKLAYYYGAATDYSAQGNMYKDWKAAVRSWARKDEKQNKIKFDVKTVPVGLGGLC